MIFRYDDDSVFDGEWEDAPGYGVQFISFYEPVKDHPVLRHQGDFYRLDDDGSVVAMDMQSLLRYVADDLVLVERKSLTSDTKLQAMIDLVVDLGLVKVGSMVSQHQWTKIYSHAKQDRDSLR